MRAALETTSEHPLAQAILRRARADRNQRLLPLKNLRRYQAWGQKHFIGENYALSATGFL